jgi:hypothetical protein
MAGPYMNSFQSVDVQSADVMGNIEGVGRVTGGRMRGVERLEL